MPETMDGFSVSPTPTLPTAMRFGRWALFILAVAAAAVTVRQASDLDRGDARRQIAEPTITAASPSDPPSNVADGAAAAALAPAPVVSAGSGSLDRSYSIASGGELNVDVAIGDIQVTRAPGPQARVVVELEPGAAPEKVRIVEEQVSPGVVRLSIEPTAKDGRRLSFFGGHLRLGGDSPMNLKIRQVRVEIPPGVRVGVSTGAGDIEASDIASDVRAETGSGDIAVQRAGAVDASTGAGDVSLRDVTGNVHVESGAGDVEIHGAAAPVHVETGAGGIIVVGASAALHLESGMGSIRVRVASVSAPIQAETGMGSIDLTVDAGGFDLEAESGMGSVAVTTSGQTERSQGMSGELRRAVGGGGHGVRLESGAGSIDVRAPASGSSRTAT